MNSAGYFKRWLLPIAITAVISLFLWLVTTVLDYWVFAPPDSFTSVLLLGYADTAKYIFTAIGQSLAAVLGITMMVVLLVVQLAAARYSHSLIQLYIEDRSNTFVLSLFVVSIVYSFWVGNTVKDTFVPTIGLLVALVLATACFVSLIPYFRHVFGFLEPEAIVSRLESKAIVAMKAGADEKEADRRIVNRMGQIGRIATTSVSQMETDVAVNAIQSVERLCRYHLEFRGRGNDPKIHPVEIEALSLLNRIYGLALNKARDVTYAAAGSGRNIAEAALKLGRGEVPKESLKLLNSMLRASINEKDSLSIYHLLHQYRLLAETLLAQCDDRILEVMFFFKYYALAAEQAKVRFIVDTVAYDLNILCQKAWQCGSPVLEPVLESFLEMEPYLERHGEREVLYPVRKMYGVLAGHFLAGGALSLAQPLLDRLRAMPEKEQEWLKEELLTSMEPYFWEFTERKVNFNYMGERQRECLRPYLEQL